MFFTDCPEKYPKPRSNSSCRPPLLPAGNRRNAAIPPGRRISAAGGLRQLLRHREGFGRLLSIGLIDLEKRVGVFAPLDRAGFRLIGSLYEELLRGQRHRRPLFLAMIPTDLYGVINV